LVKLLGENFSLEIRIIHNQSGPSPKLPGNDHLGDLQQKQVCFLHVLAIVFEDIKILGGLAVFFEKQAIKGVVDFDKEEVFKVLG